MSFNQSRLDNSAQCYRKTGTRYDNSGQQRGFTAVGPAKDGGCSSTTSPITARVASSSRSFNNSSRNVQGQPSASSSVQNGAHGQSAPHDAPFSRPSATQKSTQPGQIGPSPNVAAGSSDASVTAPATLAKARSDGSRGVSFQFGSLSPVLMNGMQIPALTSSAPPNLDEQKGDQARYQSYKAAVPVPIPSVPKQQLPRKDVGGVDYSNHEAAQPPSKVKREAQVSSVSPAAQTQKPPTGMAMQTPFQHPQVSVQFGVPNTQIHPQSMISMPMEMPLPIGSAPQLQQQLFVHGHPNHHPNHTMQPQGIIPPGQVMRYSTPMCPQITPQLGNLGVGHTSQHPQQHIGNFGGDRKPVKITDPRTHEELRLDKQAEALLEGASSVVRPQANPPQSQSIPTFGTAHPINYYNNPYNGGVFYHPNFPLATIHITSSSLPPRFSQAQPTLPSMNSSVLTSMALNKTSTPICGISESLNSEPAVSPASPRVVQVTVKPAPTPVVEKAEYTSAPICSPAVLKGESPKPIERSRRVSLGNPSQNSEVCSERSPKHPMFPKSGRHLASNLEPIVLSVPSTSAPVESLRAVTNTDSEKKKSLGGSISIWDRQKEPTKKEHLLAQHQVSGLEHDRDNEFVEAKTAQALFTGGDVVLESGAPLTINMTLSDASESKTDNVLDVTAITTEVRSSETLHENGRSKKDDLFCSNILVSTSTSAYSIKSEADASDIVSPTISDVQGICYLDTYLSRSNSLGGNANAASKYSTSDHCLATTLPQCPSEATSKQEGGGEENNTCGQACLPVSVSKDKPASELTRSKSATVRARKNRKESILKADATGIVSDIYMAYKVPEENKEPAIFSESVEITSSRMQVPADVAQENRITSEGGGQGKAKPDYWEGTADISTPKHCNMAKKYSRDFLLKFAEQCTIIPDDLDVKPDIGGLLSDNVNILHLADRESYPSPGRFIDRPSGGSRLDRRGSGVMDDDKWIKQHGVFPSRDVRLDMSYTGTIVGFKSGQGGNNGVLKKPRSPAQYIGGILSGPQQSLGPPGGMLRNNPDADHWQRATSFQKGLFSSQQSPFQAMHKAERRYEIGKITDEEEAKQRRLKAILNKLTPQNFEKLFEQVKAVNIDNALTLTGIISQIFDKALTEPTFCEMYANFCSCLSVDLPDLLVENETITFKRLLLNKCQEEFEKGKREQEEADIIEEGKTKQSDQEREQKGIEARRRMLGNIRLIGELYKKRMLTDRIMHECIITLLGEFHTPDEENIEALCKLMSTIGEMFDQPRAKDHMNGYSERMANLSNNVKLSSRVRFMLWDVIDLRNNKWQQRRKIEGPKKIEEVHRDAAQERAHIGRMGRGPGINPPARRPMDFGPRGLALVTSSKALVGGYRGLPMQNCGVGAQDVRLDDRHSHNGRPLSVPLSQKSISDDSITLGPQGGLAKEMSIRGQPSISSNTSSDMTPSPGDLRIMASGANDHTLIQEWTSHNSREDAIPRYMLDKITHHQSNIDGRNTAFGYRDMKNQDRNLDKYLANSTPTQVQGRILPHSVASGKVWPEERLRDMSLAAIKEFYSAKDEKEVALCIKDLNSPSFYPTMISIWVIDSFERKDGERDLLAKLLVTLAKSRDGMLSQPQLIKGFEAVLITLDDAVNDAPKAAEFLGRMFAKIVLENVVPLGEICQIIYDGGGGPGSLRDDGLTAEVLGSTLEMIKSEKGDSMLNEIRKSSSLRLEEFKHPDPYKSRKLRRFI